MKKLLVTLASAALLAGISSAFAATPAGYFAITVVNDYQKSTQPLKVVSVAPFNGTSGAGSMTQVADTLSNAKIPYGAGAHQVYSFTNPGAGWNNPYQMFVTLAVGSKQCGVLVIANVPASNSTSGLQNYGTAGGLCNSLRLTAQLTGGNTYNVTVNYVGP